MLRSFGKNQMKLNLFFFWDFTLLILRFFIGILRLYRGIKILLQIKKNLPTCQLNKFLEKNIENIIYFY